MANLTVEQISEIAEMLDCGFRSYWHKNTGELLFVPDNEFDTFDDEEVDEDFEKINNNPDDYIEIDKPESHDSFKIMENFAKQLEGNDKLRAALFNALSKRKPFREFMWVIDDSGDHRQEWFDFKKAQLIRWVKIHFDTAMNITSEEDSE